ncbi:MAG: HD domain-containing protein [Parolsenella sp.]|nr:HD domain-containing protein [Parolsenella sp.]
MESTINCSSSTHRDNATAHDGPTVAKAGELAAAAPDGNAAAPDGPAVPVDRERARAAFLAYVAPYDPANPRIALKIAHALRVADLCDRIAHEQSWPAADIDLAWLCGLLHDMGRFEQVRRWDTFRDAVSCSHAKLGASVLFDEREHLGAPVPAGDPDFGTPRIRDFIDSSAEDAVIRAAVELHSDYRLPRDLDPRTRVFTELVRDADKIDILRTVDEDTPETILGCDADELLASSLSPAATRAFGARRCMLRDDRSQPADFLVSFACFAFELAYPQSRGIMREQGYATALLTKPFGIEAPFRNPHTRSEFQRMAHELDLYLEGVHE